MKTIIVSDIFGRTQALAELAQAIDNNSVDEKNINDNAINNNTIIVDPYEKAPYHKTEMNFRDEQSAYDCFVNQVGMDAYCQLVCEVVKAQTKPVLVIGFSVGASAIWNASEDPELSNVSKAIGYYGSQIRHKPQIQPRFPFELVFPVMEKHFSIDNLGAQLINTANVSIRTTAYLHGFMNRLSDNFNKQGYDSEVIALKQRLQ